MIGRLNHVGIATPSIATTAAMYVDLFGATVARERFALPEQGVWVSFIDLANSQLELIEPLGEASPVWELPEEEPGGRAASRLLRGARHHRRARRDAQSWRDRARHRRARIGAHRVPVIFVHPRDTGGVLVELMATPVEGGHG